MDSLSDILHISKHTSSNNENDSSNNSSEMKWIIDGFHFMPAIHKVNDRLDSLLIHTIVQDCPPEEEVTGRTSRMITM